MSPLVLLVGSLTWTNLSRLAIACRTAGFVVHALAPADNPVHDLRSPRRTFVYRGLRPAASLRRAIELSAPDLIIPCDDPIVRRLHRLHAEVSRREDGRDPSSTRALIERSLGSPRAFKTLQTRASLASLSALPEVRIPPTRAIHRLRELKEWVEAHGLPAVLKLDGSYGGDDVVFMGDAAALGQAFLNMRSRQLGLRRLKNRIRRLNAPFNISRDGLPEISVQAFVEGRPANCAVACWQGEVLSAIAVESVRLESEKGVSTVVRVVEGRAMKAAAQAIVRALHLSGMCGFDFMLEEASGRPNLIEINPRATQINHLRLGEGPDLPTALRLALAGQTEPAPCAPTSEVEIALFPHVWSLDPASPYAGGAYDDLPYEEPQLLRRFGYGEPAVVSGRALHEEAGRLGRMRAAVRRWGLRNDPVGM